VIYLLTLVLKHATKSYTKPLQASDKKTTMTLEIFFTKLRSEIQNYNNGRSDSSAFIIWFLENFFRIDKDDAIGCVCDQKNDKGIDGVFVDDEEEIVYLIQSKFSPNDFQEQGDNDLRNFVGAKEWFKNEETLQHLLESTASRELKALVNGMSLIQKTHYKVILVFITNKKFNTHANEFINVTNDYEFWDCDSLLEKYTYFADNEVVFPNKDLYLTNKSLIEYDLPNQVKAKVYSIPAKELVKLEGIQDRTLFYKNVRYGVGKTRVNKSIKSSITNQSEHHNFFLYHNGITIICETLETDENKDKITIGNYAVINGCQSMLTLYENKTHLTKNLSILTKIIELDPNSSLVKDITYYANNQNSISIKDLRSNDSVQKSLQKEFEDLFDNKVLYNRKRGEDVSSFNTVIDKDFAAQLISAFYQNKPHNTHLKQKLFGDDYNSIFSRNITADKIYLAYLVYSIIKDNTSLLDNEKIRNYGLAIFFFTNIIKVIFEEDELGVEILKDPKSYVTTNYDRLRESIEKLWNIITPDINFDIEEYTTQNEGFLDYKNVFKNSVFVKTMSGKIKSDYVRLTRRNINDSFKEIYRSTEQETSL
jgi:hypothetical protein